MTTPTVSGPGALSRRTDRGPAQKLRELPDADYGEQAVYQDLQKGAPLAQDPNGGLPPEAQAAQAAASQVIPFGEGSQQPGVPVTDGAAAGAGAGVEALGLPNQPQEDLTRLLPYLPVLEFMSGQPGSSWAMRNVVRKLKAGL
jgi:hypothetical protein